LYFNGGRDYLRDNPSTSNASHYDARKSHAIAALSCEQLKGYGYRQPINDFEVKLAYGRVPAVDDHK
jgi:hypothetical protein